MKNKSLTCFRIVRSLAIVAGLVISVGPSYGRHTTHGTDNQNLEAEAAWFLGRDRTIRYCVEVSPDFGVTVGDVVEAVSSAFSAWSTYIETKIPLADIETNFRHRSFTLQSALTSCNGSEDLHLMFGVMSEKVVDAIKQYDDPVAFAKKEVFDTETGWSRGFLWFSNPRKLSMLDAFNKTKEVDLKWTYGAVSNAVVRHEIGHVYGVEHVAGTVMDENILRRLLAPKLDAERCPNPSASMANIDDVIELAPCLVCNAEMGMTQKWRGVVTPQVFQDLTGRAPLGKVSATVTVTNGRLVDSRPLFKTYQKGVKLDLTDEHDQRTFNLGTSVDGDRSVRRSRGFFTVPKLFRILFEEQSVIHTFAFEPVSEVLRHLKAIVAGRPLDANLEYNVGGNDAPVVIRADGSSEGVIFRSFSSATNDGCRVFEASSDPFWKHVD